MHISDSLQPIPYSPAVETLEENEADTIAELEDILRGVSATTLKHSGHATRGVHAKSHGLLVGELTVMDGLPDAYTQGLFAQAGSYPAVMRISTTPGDVLDDKVSTPRGVGLKIIGVPGARVAGNGSDSTQDNTQDFVLVNGPAFIAPSAKQFVPGTKLLAATTDKAPNLKRMLSAFLRGTEEALEKGGIESAALRSLGGQPFTHPLGDTYFSQAPILYGPYMAKVSLAPVSSNLLALTDAPVDLSGTPDGLRQAIIQHFSGQGGEWELRIQLCTDLASMPIEDSSVEWPQEASPYVAVARLRLEPQAAWNPELSRLIDDGMQFNPWHALAAHRPIGSIMRTRKMVYAMSKRFRSEHNGVPIVEPRDVDAIRGAAISAGK